MIIVSNNVDCLALMEKKRIYCIRFKLQGKTLLIKKLSITRSTLSKLNRFNEEYWIYNKIIV